MMHINRLLLVTSMLFTCCASFAQDRRDKATYAEPPKNEFWEKLNTETSEFFAEKAEPKKRLTMDYRNIDVPKSVSEFKIVTADKPVSQGITGTCWCFSTTSFYESEAARKGKTGIHLSEMYTVYWQYVEKAREYVRTRGTSIFDEGSETNAVQQMMKKYGALPLESYTGTKPGQPYHDHSKMVAEMKSYLEGVKERNAWNSEAVVGTIKDIMDHYIGTPPTSIILGGKMMSPQQYLTEVVGIVPDDYVTFMSLKSERYWASAEYKVDDNWWHSKDYYNIPLNDFVVAVKSSLKKGYSVSIGGDVSESGIDSKKGLMMIPSYDIPASAIDENARLLRFLNGATTDDHAMHIIGYTEKPNGTWFLVKDSGSGGRANDEHNGYWFMHEDYVKLKMMTATVNKAAVSELLTKVAAR